MTDISHILVKQLKVLLSISLHPHPPLSSRSIPWLGSLLRLTRTEDAYCLFKEKRSLLFYEKTKYDCMCTRKACSVRAPLSDVMAAVWKVWRHVKSPTTSVDAYLLDEQSCQISSKFDPNLHCIAIYRMYYYGCLKNMRGHGYWTIFILWCLFHCFYVIDFRRFICLFVPRSFCLF